MVLALVACKGKEKPKEAVEPVAPAPAAVADAAQAAEAPPPAPTPTPPPAPSDQPPLSADVLPRDEATPKTRAVIADDFRFQIPESFTKAEQDGHVVYTGTVEGFASPATMTFWASSEPFKGNLDALVKRETKAAADAKGEKPDVGPVMVFVADQVKQGYAKRLTIKFPDRIELRTVVAHDGKAFIMHCATPNVSNAWANVGSDCITRSTTFNVAPLPLKPVKKPAGPPPPDVPNVKFMASKVEGTARQKTDVKPWLEDIAPFVKPCFASLEKGTSFKVSFEIAPDGAVGKSGVTDKDDKPADAKLAECAAKALATQKLDGKAAAATKVTMIFAVVEPF